MAKSETPKTPEHTSDSFFGAISDALSYLKNKLISKQSPREIQENIPSKEQQESGKNRIDLQELQKETLIGKEKREVKSELFGLHEKIVPKSKNTSQKNALPYSPTHIETQVWLQNNQDKRPAAPRIAQSADALRDDIKSSPILNYFLG